MNIDLVEKYQEFKEYSEKVLYWEDSKRAFYLINLIKENLDRQNLEENNKSLFKKYQRMILKLKWVSLNFLEYNEIEGLFRKYFSSILSLPTEYNLWENFKKKLLTEIIYADRDKFKKRIRNILRSNNEIIIKYGDLRSVKDWIGEYNKTFGEKIVDDVEKIKFFGQNHHFRSLNSKDRALVKKILDFYERLKLSSRSLAGNEGEIPLPDDFAEYASIRDGKLIIPSKKNTNDLLEKALKAYRASQNINVKKRKSAPSKRLTQKQVDSISSIKKSNPVRLPRIDELKQMAAKYPEGSLERKAIEDEIKRMEGRG